MHNVFAGDKQASGEAFETTRPISFSLRIGSVWFALSGKLCNENVNQFSHDLPLKSMDIFVRGGESFPDKSTPWRTHRTCKGLSHSMPIANWVHLLAANIDMTDTFLFYFICIFISLSPAGNAPGSATFIRQFWFIFRLFFSIFLQLHTVCRGKPLNVSSAFAWLSSLACPFHTLRVYPGPLPSKCVGGKNDILISKGETK